MDLKSAESPAGPTAQLDQATRLRLERDWRLTMSERLDLRSLLAALHEGEVRFVLIGGVAVGAHGYVRATGDVDIVPDPF